MLLFTRRAKSDIKLRINSFIPAAKTMSGEIEDLAAKPKDFKPKGKYVVRTPTDQQRVRLEKLMENPSKPVAIPMSRQQKDLLAAVPTFVRNVMGSSAGAGSGEFHVYRHLRRKEFARQKQIQHKSRQEELDEQFAQKVEDDRNTAESKTAKKRAKRQKKKQQRKVRPARADGATANGNGDDDVEHEEEDEEEDDGDGEVRVEADGVKKNDIAVYDNDDDGPSSEKRRKLLDKPSEEREAGEDMNAIPTVAPKPESSTD